MEERQPMAYVEDENNLISKYFAILRPAWWKIILLSVIVGIGTLVLMFLQPNLYRASATIKPSADEGKQNASLGALAASFGLPIGAPTKLEDLEALFKSKSLTVRVFQNYNLWPMVFPKRFNPKTDKLKVRLIDRLFGEKGPEKAINDWDAIRSSEKKLKVIVNRRNGNLSILFESISPEGSANIVSYYLDEGKSRLQEEALDRAGKNKKFIEEQIVRTVDPLTRDRLYTLYGEEVEREMLAKNREQFGFKIIDLPIVPDRKSNPQRALTAILTTLISFILFTIIFGLFMKRREGHPEAYV
jgi:uncharacterized protein involved in exopolysaccharide biosynthesis